MSRQAVGEEEVTISFERNWRRMKTGLSRQFSWHPVCSVAACATLIGSGTKGPPLPQQCASLRLQTHAAATACELCWT